MATAEELERRIVEFGVALERHGLFLTMLPPQNMSANQEAAEISAKYMEAFHEYESAIMEGLRKDYPKSPPDLIELYRLCEKPENYSLVAEKFPKGHVKGLLPEPW